MIDYRSRLEELDRAGLLRRLPEISNGMLEFSSNDYLGLSHHELLMEASVQAAVKYGTSVSASRLMSGNIPLYEELEEALAELAGMESALIFGSGFLANTGLLACITTRDDDIFLDRLSHASLVDGSLLSRSRLFRYRHCDMDHLEQLLSSRQCTGSRFIVTDSLFSMDGDIAPLEDLWELSCRYGCTLVVDEAHAMGVFGDGGGICREMDIHPHVLIGTLSKAMGSYGGFIAGSEDLKRFLVNRARTFIYSTGLPPAVAGASLAAVRFVGESPGIGRELLERASRFRTMLASAGYSTEPSRSQIIPVVIGDNVRTLDLSRTLETAGIRAVAVRPPTVPAGTSRLRFSVTLDHSDGDLEHAARVMDQLGRG